jgi:Bacterial regulatory helix-turn-helix protein, lysR family
MISIVIIKKRNNRDVMPSLEQSDLRFLRIFDAMHANRHVTRAAEELGLSQPTISIGLGKLRQQVADPLTS